MVEAQRSKTASATMAKQRVGRHTPKTAKRRPDPGASPEREYTVPPVQVYAGVAPRAGHGHPKLALQHFAQCLVQVVNAQPVQRRPHCSTICFVYEIAQHSSSLNC